MARRVFSPLYDGSVDQLSFDASHRSLVGTLEADPHAISEQIEVEKDDKTTHLKDKQADAEANGDEVWDNSGNHDAEVLKQGYTSIRTRGKPDPLMLPLILTLLSLAIGKVIWDRLELGSYLCSTPDASLVMNATSTKVKNKNRHKDKVKACNEMSGSTAPPETTASDLSTPLVTPIPTNV